MVVADGDVPGEEAAEGAVAFHSEQATYDREGAACDGKWGEGKSGGMC